MNQSSRIAGKHDYLGPTLSFSVFPNSAPDNRNIRLSMSGYFHLNYNQKSAAILTGTPGNKRYAADFDMQAVQKIFRISRRQKFPVLCIGDDLAPWVHLQIAIFPYIIESKNAARIWQSGFSLPQWGCRIGNMERFLSSPWTYLDKRLSNTFALDVEMVAENPFGNTRMASCN